MIAVWALVATMAPGASGLAADSSLFSGLPRLEVRVFDHAAQPLPWVTLGLCAEPREPTLPQHCRWAVSDAGGEALFEEIPRGVYRLEASLSGFAGTTVAPLSIGGPDPIAPERVLMTLNPVCYDC